MDYGPFGHRPSPLIQQAVNSERWQLKLPQFSVPDIMPRIKAPEYIVCLKPSEKVGYVSLVFGGGGILFTAADYVVNSMNNISTTDADLLANIGRAAFFPIVTYFLDTFIKIADKEYKPSIVSNS